MSLVCVGVLIAPPAPAQTVTHGSWANVESLRVEATIRVEKFRERGVVGRFLNADANSVVVRTRSGEVTVARQDVREVSARSISARAKNSGIAAAVGGGFAAGAITLFVVSLGGTDSWTQVFWGATLFGALCGFGLGWLFPGYSTVYKARL